MTASAPLSAPARPRGDRRRKILMAAFLAMCVAVAATMALSWVATVQTLDRLGSTDSDNLTWSLTQLHVDNLRLENALQAAMRSGPGDQAALNRVRLKFDLLYSRAASLSDTPLHRVLETNGVNVAVIDQVSEALADYVPLIDGPDAGLFAGLPQISERFKDIDPVIRRLTVDGVRMVELDAGRQREELRDANAAFALASALMVITMTVVSLYVLGLNRTIVREYRKRHLVQENMRAALEASLDAIVVFSADGRIVSWNPAASRSFAFQADDAGTRSILSLFPHAEDVRRFSAELERFRTTGVSTLIGAGRVTLAMRCADARLVPVEAAFVPALTVNDQRLMVGFLRDVSERVEAEKRLRNALHAANMGNEIKRRILTVLSHELRTPLQGLTGMLQALHSEFSGSPRPRTMVEAAMHAATHATRIANNALDSSELLTGTDVAPAVETFDMVALLQGLRDEHQDLAQRQSTRMELRLPPRGSWTVRADRRVVRLALSNLIHNAVQFTREGHVTIEASVLRSDDGQNQVHVRIADTGPGIAVEHQLRVFNDFETLEDALARESRGAGLGLGIVRRAVDRLGGTLTLNSAPGKGTRFDFSFPAEIVAEAPTSHPAPPQTVLVVEDNATNREALVAMLTQLGLTVDSARDGLEAVEIASRTAFDLILMDIAMPGLDGVAATRKIRATDTGARARIVVVSAYADPADRQRFLAAGVDSVLTKPVGLNDLRQLTERTTAAFIELDSPDASRIAEMVDVLGVQRVSELLNQLATEAAQVLRDALSPAVDQAQSAADLHRIAGAVALFGLDGLRELLIQAEKALLENDAPRAQHLILAAEQLQAHQFDDLRQALPIAA